MIKKTIFLLSLFFGGSMPVSQIAAAATSENPKLVYPYVFAPSEGLVNPLEADFRSEICLNGYWDFLPVALPSDYRQGAGKAPALPLPSSDAKWEDTKLKIPSPWNINSFANRNLVGPDHRNYPSYPKAWDDVKMGWMKKDVTVPADWAGSKITLYFEAVAGDAEIYVNGKKVGENFDLFLPFSFDVTDVVTPGEKAEVMVGVRSQSLFEDNSTVGRRIVPAGSMWGYHINGIWQDVYTIATPQVNISDIYVKPLVSQNKLQLDVTLENVSDKKSELTLSGDIYRWLNQAGTDVNSAPVPAWKLGEKAIAIPQTKVTVPADAKAVVTVDIPVNEGQLDYWTPETPNLYSIVMTAADKKKPVDRKYQRFGWREWTLDGTSHCLNGKPYPLRGDSWHFMGIPQMTRRYAWAWFTAIKGMNGNAVRPHAQVYPRFYLDMADEMGICVLDETANWASDGGPKVDSDLFWENSKDHLTRFVLRDRNHPAVFGWSISNENKPVILHVFNRPDLLPGQKQAWADWRDIVRANDPTRPWISADGEDDGDGILPVTVGHYGDMNSMKHWVGIGKPWGIGEHSMAYYGTPEQVSVYNGERAYESQQGRMEGLANECYNLIANQRNMGASYSTVFNMVWYALQPMPFGKKDITTPPTLDDGVFFGEFVEGCPGVQPERVGPYSSTLNPGYDPNLPLYREWPMYAAMRAANAPDGPAWSEYAVVDKDAYNAPAPSAPAELYAEVMFVGPAGSRAKKALDVQGVKFTDKIKKPKQAIIIADGSVLPDDKLMTEISRLTAAGADLWIWGITPATLSGYNDILPAAVEIDDLKRSTFLPAQKLWMEGLNNSDFYFCELQRVDASEYSLKGDFVEEGVVMLDACPTDWRKWNKQAEEIKTASTLRSLNECASATPVFVKNSKGDADFYVSTITEFANSTKGYKTLSRILTNAGIPFEAPEADVESVFFLRDDQIQFPSSSRTRFTGDGDSRMLTVYVYSPRPLDDLLIEPNMPKLSLFVKAKSRTLKINGKEYDSKSHDGRNEAIYKELPLLQGWNRVDITVDKNDVRGFEANFRCDNRREFLQLLNVSFTNPEQ